MNALPVDEAALLRRAAAFSDLPTLPDCTPEAMLRVTETQGIDFATALLYDRFVKCPSRSPFVTRMEALLKSPPDQKFRRRWKVIVVPGALYLERPALGSGGEIIRETAEALGLECARVPLASRGSVRQNAALLSRWLETQPDEPMVLVTVSKGGADMKLALAGPGASGAFGHVVAWVNLSGPLDGSPAADWIPASRLRTWAVRLQYRIQRRDFGFITDMCHGPGSLLREPLQLPARMRLVSLLGFPLRAHLTTPLARFSHGIVARLGPNDGTALLSESRAWPGEIFPVWGADHYFRPAHRAQSLLRAVFRHLDEVCGGSGE